MPMPKTIGHVIKFPKTIGGTLRKAYWEIPEIVASTGMAIIGGILAVVGCYNYAKNDGDNREFKMVYYVVRDNDPRAALLKNPVYTEFTKT